MKQQYPEAVCAVIRRGDKIVGVSRRDDHTAFGLPGGKVDDGWSKIQALYDEVLHETNLHITSHKEIYSCVDGDGYLCTTYLCEADGNLSSENENPTIKGIGIVKEITWDELFVGPFGIYNREVYNALQNNDNG